ncbi:MAG: hypothetical protein ABFR02_07395 [Campylobacterota bacterium]
MNNETNLALDPQTLEKLAAFGELLKKDTQTMINEALEQYFEAREEELAQQDPMTNLSFDEFWDDVDL